MRGTRQKFQRLTLGFVSAINVQSARHLSLKHTFLRMTVLVAHRKVVCLLVPGTGQQGVKKWAFTSGPQMAELCRQQLIHTHDCTCKPM